MVNGGVMKGMVEVMTMMIEMVGSKTLVVILIIMDGTKQMIETTKTMTMGEEMKTKVLSVTLHMKPNNQSKISFLFYINSLDNNRDADSKKDQIEDDGDCDLEGSLEEELATLPDHLIQKARKLMCKYQKEGLRPEEASIGKASPQLHEETNDLYSDLKEAGFNFDEDEDENEDEDEDGLF